MRLFPNRFLDKDRLLETQAYSVETQYETYWTAAKVENYCCIMPVFDTNDSPINPNRFTEKLVDAMCEVTFTLRHYAIGGNRAKGVDANDIFSAQVESVVILKKPPVLARSPYKGRLTRRPVHKPQLPTRGEQVNAAAAFLPQPDFGLITTGKPTILPLVSGTPAKATDGADRPVVVAHTHTQGPKAALTSTIPVELNAKVLAPQGKFTTLIVLEYLQNCLFLLPQLQHLLLRR